MLKTKKQKLQVILAAIVLISGLMAGNSWLVRAQVNAEVAGIDENEKAKNIAETTQLRIENFDTTAYQQALAVFQDKRDNYLTLKARYDRLGYEDLKPDVLAAARETLMARNQVALDYLAWLSTIVAAYVDDSVVLATATPAPSVAMTASESALVTLDGETKPATEIATTAQVATTTATIATTPEPTVKIKDQFQGRIASLQGLLEWQTADAKAIASWEDWENFAQDDTLVATFQSRLYPILTYIILQEMAQDQTALKAVFPVVETEILSTTQREVVKEEEQKTLTQNAQKLDNVGATLAEWEAVWLEVDNEATYNNFVQVAAGLTAKQREIVGSLNGLYSWRNK